jgi:Ca2+-binding EF-hand superfamily protein
MSTVDRKVVIEEERKKIFTKPIVTQNPSFDAKQIEDFYTLFNLYADNRRQADIREIVTTAQTLGYDKSHEFIFQALVDIATHLDGEWVGFEQFLTLLTDAMVPTHPLRATPPPKKDADRPSHS